MSLTSPVPGPGGVVVTAIGRSCFFCHAPVTDPAVAWSGSEGEILVHPECIGPWFIRMARDAHEAMNPAYSARRKERR